MLGEIDFYDLVGVGSAGMTIQDKINLLKKLNICITN